MKSTNIVPDQWQRFCEDFSRQHRGWLVTTSILERSSHVPAADIDESRAHRTARDLPFGGLSLEPNRRDLMLLLGEGKLHVTEHITDVIRIGLLETDEGAHAGLRIDKSNDTGVLLRFRVAARPESLDGVAASER